MPSTAWNPNDAFKAKTVETIYKKEICTANYASGTLEALNDMNYLENVIIFLLISVSVEKLQNTEMHRGPHHVHSHISK